MILMGERFAGNSVVIFALFLKLPCQKYTIYLKIKRYSLIKRYRLI